jgi:hypothetical protein
VDPLSLDLTPPRDPRELEIGGRVSEIWIRNPARFSDSAGELRDDLQSLLTGSRGEPRQALPDTRGLRQERSVSSAHWDLCGGRLKGRSRPRSRFGDRRASQGVTLSGQLEAGARPARFGDPTSDFDEPGAFGLSGCHGSRENRCENQPSGNGCQCRSVGVSTGLSGRGVVAATCLVGPYRSVKAHCGLGAGPD